MYSILNLRALCEDMKAKGWGITAFCFAYKQVRYIVLVKRFIRIERKNEYAKAILHFMKESNLEDDLEVEANVNELLGDSKRIRNYFGIGKAGSSWNEALEDLYSAIGKAMPERMTDPDMFDTKVKDALVRSLSLSDSEDPNKRYCYEVRRNPIGQQRTPYNSDKTRILRKKLYSVLGQDFSISFCYSNDPSKEATDAVIIKRFSEKQLSK